jgi:hypothetical protein
MSNADSGAGSLRAAIAGANSGDTIVFARSVHAITLTSGELLIPASLAIDGPGADKLTISGNNLSRVFEIAAGPDASNPLNVTISNLTITHGNAVAEGGGILNDGSNVTLSNDRITQNVVTESPTDLTPGTTEFYAQGGGLFSVAGNLSINNCHVIANQAVGLAGTNAYGDALGGGVSVVGGTVSITDSIFANNLAQAANDAQDGEAGGGGLQISAPLTLSDSTISGNRAVAGNNPTPYGPTGGGGGSASAAGMEFYSTAMISNCNFSSNEAFGGNGGTGVFAGEAEGGAVYAGGPGTFINCNFTDNLARAGSGGNGGTSTSSLASGVEPGVDTSYGGALCSLFGYAYGNSLNVTNSAFTDNKAVGGNNATATGSDIVEVGDAEGGAICSEIGTVATISGCTLDHNAAIGGSDNTGSGGQVAHIGDGLGGAIDSSFGSDGSDGHIGATTLTLSNSNLFHNTAQGGNDNNGSASLADLVGAGVGSGIANYLGSTATISGSVLDQGQAIGGKNNTAGGTGSVFAGLGAGGGIFNYLGNYTSLPTSDEGYGPLIVSTVSVTDSTLDHNLADGGGGGNGEGGGIANLLAATTTVDDSSLTHNEADGDCRGAGLGGGAYNDASSTLALTDSSVTENQADGSPGMGGGVYNDLGTLNTDATDHIMKNFASTSNDNIFNP